MKKVLSFILAFAIVFSSVPLAAFSNFNLNGFFPFATITAEAATSVVITTGDANPTDNDTWLDIDSDRVEWTCSSSSAKSYRYSVRKLDKNGDDTDVLLANRKLTTNKYFKLSSLSGLDGNSIYRVWVGAFSDSSGNTKIDGGCEAYFRTNSTMPTVTTGKATNIGDTYVTLSGTLEKNGGASVTDHGFVVSTSSSKLTLTKGDVYSLGSAGDNKGTFTRKITGLSRAKKYYFAYYAKNENGVEYGDAVSFTTTCSHEKTDEKISTSNEVIYKSISSSKHELKCYYDKYCTLCYQTIDKAYRYDTTAEDHSFNTAGICEDCGYAKSCAHKNQNKEYYDERYNIINSQSHEYVRYYTLVCDDCGIDVDTKVMWDTTTQNHSFLRNECTKCGYVKNQALSVTLTADSATVNVNTNFGAQAQATGGAGGYQYTHSVFNESGEELSYLSYSETTRFSYMAKKPGKYYFKVTVKDSSGNTASATSATVTVICPHETYDTSKFQITSSPEYEQYNESQHYTVWYYNWDCTICGQRYKEHVTDEDNRVIENHVFNTAGMCTECFYSCPHSVTENKKVTYTVSNIGNAESHKVIANVSMSCKQCKSKIKIVEEDIEPHNGNGMLKLSNGAITCSCQYEANMPSTGLTMYILKNETVYSSTPTNGNRNPIGSVFGPKVGVDGDKVIVLGYTNDNSYAYIQYNTSKGTKRGFVSSNNLSKDKPVLDVFDFNENILENSSYFTMLYDDIVCSVCDPIYKERFNIASTYISYLRSAFERAYYKFLEWDFEVDYYELAMAEFMLTENFVFEQTEELKKEHKLGLMKIAGYLLTAAKNEPDIFIVNDETFINSVISVLDGTGLENSQAYKYTTEVLSKLYDAQDGFTAENIASLIYNGGAYIDDLADFAETALDVTELFKSAANFCAAFDAYQKMDDTFKTVFSYAKTKATKNGLKRAFSYYSDEYTQAWQKKVRAYAKAGVAAADLLTFEFVSDIAIDFAKKQLGIILKNFPNIKAFLNSGVVIGAKIGIEVSKILFNTASLNEDLSLAIAYYDISECFDKAYDYYDSKYSKSPNYQNASLSVCAMQNSAALLMFCANELLGYYNIHQNHFLTAVKDHCVKVLGKEYSFKEQLADIRSLKDGAYNIYSTTGVIRDRYKDVDTSWAAKSANCKVTVVACPVDVYVYDVQGNLVCYTNGTKSYNNSYSVACCVVGEEKYIALPDTDDYKVKIIGTDNGTMDVSVSLLNANNSVTDEVSYNDIPVFSSEQYNTEIEEKFFETPEEQSITSSKSDYHPSEIKSYVKITGIEIVSNPIKTSYNYKSVSYPDLSGMIIKATYSDGSSEIIDDVSNVQIKDFSSSKPVGSKVATIEYKGCTAQFNYSVSYTWWQWLIRIIFFGILWY